MFKQTLEILKAFEQAFFTSQEICSSLGLPGLEGHSFVHAQQRQIYHLNFPTVPFVQGMLLRGSTGASL